MLRCTNVFFVVVGQLREDWDSRKYMYLQALIFLPLFWGHGRALARGEAYNDQTDLPSFEDSRWQNKYTDFKCVILKKKTQQFRLAPFSLKLWPDILATSVCWRAYYNNNSTTWTQRVCCHLYLCRKRTILQFGKIESDTNIWISWYVVKVKKDQKDKVALLCCSGHHSFPWTFSFNCVIQLSNLSANNKHTGTWICWLIPIL